MTDFATARRMMVDGQVRTADVTDLRLIVAMQEIPRERFVSPADSALAYLDLAAPVGSAKSGRRLLKPMVLAKLIQAAGPTGRDHVLIVGCASGYSAAVMSQLAGSVVALEEDAALVKLATAELAGIPNVTVVKGKLTDGWAQSAPYDAILLDGATEFAPEALCRQLKDSGRLVCIEGSGPASKAKLYRRSGEEAAGRPLFDASGPVLPGFVKPAVFAF